MPEVKGKPHGKYKSAHLEKHFFKENAIHGIPASEKEANHLSSAMKELNWQVDKTIGIVSEFEDDDADSSVDEDDNDNEPV